MRAQQSPALAQAVQRIVKLNAQSKTIGLEINEVADAAYEAGLVRVPNTTAARKVLKRLAKDSISTDVEREEQRLIEESLDECRAALGLLANLPLGQAAQHSVTDPALKADGSGADPARRGRGRPKGSRNKPKLATSNGVDVPDAPYDDVPGDAPVPDIPELPAA